MAALGYLFSQMRALLAYPLYAAANVILLKVSVHTSDATLIRFNSAFTDDFAIQPQVGLYEHTIYAADQDFAYATDICQSLQNTSHLPTLRGAFREVRLRQCERCHSVDSIIRLGDSTQSLYLKDDVRLQFFYTIAQDSAIALEQNNAFTQRVYLKDCSERLMNFSLKNTARGRYSTRCAKLAMHWRALLETRAR